MKRIRGDQEYLTDILGEIEKVAAFIEGMTPSHFNADEKTVYAVIRAIEVIGEAAKKISDNVRQKQPSIPWREISGMRDKLIHDYSGVDLAVVWKTATEDLPEIEPLLQKMLSV